MLELIYVTSPKDLHMLIFFLAFVCFGTEINFKYGSNSSFQIL